MTSGQSQLVLLIEDEPQMRRFMRASLSSNDFRVLEAQGAKEGMMLLTSNNPDVVLLDLGLPDGDGLEVTKQIREFSQVPIIIISARGREDEKVVALDAGADDYLTKPFGMNELLARIRVALRNAHRNQSAPKQAKICFGDVVVDLEKREVTVSGNEVHLTPIEYKLIVLLTRHHGKVLTHRQILKEVWGPAYTTQIHHLRVHMAGLRKKIEAEPARPKWLMTEPGVGYRLRE